MAYIHKEGQVTQHSGYKTVMYWFGKICDGFWYDLIRFGKVWYDLIRFGKVLERFGEVW